MTTPTDAFATASDFATYLQRDLSAEDTASAEKYLDIATAAIRRYTGQHISAVVGESVTLDPPSGCRIFLPQLPVTAVTSVTIDGTLLSTATPDYYWYGDTGIIRLSSRWWWGLPQSIVVVYSHGYATIPADVRGVCMSVAHRAMQNPDLASEVLVNMGPASVRQTFNESVTGLQVIFTDGERAILNSYRPLVAA